VTLFIAIAVAIPTIVSQLVTCAKISVFQLHCHANKVKIFSRLALGIIHVPMTIILLMITVLMVVVLLLKRRQNTCFSYIQSGKQEKESVD